MAENEAFFELIIIGASAGGVEALLKLVADLPTPFPVPIVIAQHLDPKRPSHLTEILARHSTLSVISLEQQITLEPGTVYVIPPNHHIAITDHVINIVPHTPDRPKPSIDLLLNTAATVYGKKLIAVILTGSGSDGTAGARAVHKGGGTVIIQDPATAAYPGMPQSLAPETVNLVADLSNIGSLLFDLVTGKLEAPPEENQSLVNNFLIKATGFIPDPELFINLREQVLPRLVKYSRTHEHELRFWCAGCATGEEAYSLVIVLSELLNKELKDFRIKIFATDLDANAIAFARRGVYPEKIVAGLPKELLERYFTLSESGYVIKKSVRDLIVFGEHDLGQRAPFPRIDLVMCRNVLVYFNRELQQHSLQLFAFALRANGYLVLGCSEAVNPLPTFFVEDNPKHGIYLRQSQRNLPQSLGIKTITISSTKSNATQSSQKVNPQLVQLQTQLQQSRIARDKLLLKLPIGVVLVNRQFDIQEINNAARRLLSIHTPAIGEDFVHLAHNIASQELISTINRAFQEDRVVTLDSVQVPHLITGEANFLQITCYPHPGITSDSDSQDSNNHVLILITDITKIHKTQKKLEQADHQQAILTTELAQAIATLQKTKQELEQSSVQLHQLNLALENSKYRVEEIEQRHAHQMELLVEVNANLLTTNGEVTVLNADLRKSNEEYLMQTEDAQAVIEEADTLNEELQATNEEFDTLNEELQATNEELNTTNSNLISQGKKLEIRTQELKAQQQRSEQERAQLAAILANMQDAVLVIKPDSTPLLTNTAYQTLFGNLDQVELFDENANQPLIGQATPQAQAARGETFNLIFTFFTPERVLHWCEAAGQPIFDLDNKRLLWGVVVIRDITERKSTETQLRQTLEKQKELLDLKTRFVTTTSHEFRTPLTTILASAELLERYAEKFTNVKKTEIAQNIQSAALYMAGLLNDILIVGKFENGRAEFRPTRFKLVEFCQKLIKEFENEIFNPNQTIIKFSNHSQPDEIQLDTQLLHLILSNLLLNSIKFTPSGGTVEFNLRVRQNEVVFEIKDNGIGIPEEDQAHLFEDFFRAKNVTNIPGTGLGLNIVKHSVELHGGTVSVQSQEGIGSVFTVILPLTLPDGSV